MDPFQPLDTALDYSEYGQGLSDLSDVDTEVTEVFPSNTDQPAVLFEPDDWKDAPPVQSEPQKLDHGGEVGFQTVDDLLQTNMPDLATESATAVDTAPAPSALEPEPSDADDVLPAKEDVRTNSGQQLLPSVIEEHAPEEVQEPASSSRHHEPSMSSRLDSIHPAEAIQAPREYPDLGVAASNGQDDGFQRDEERDEGASLMELAIAAEARLASHRHATTSGAEHSTDDPTELLRYRQDLLIARLASHLDQAVPDPERPSQSSDSGATSIGAALAARSFTSPQFEPVFKKAGAQSPRGVPHGVPSAIAKFLGIVGVGLSSGGVQVLMPPSAKGCVLPTACFCYCLSYELFLMRTAAITINFAPFEFSCRAPRLTLVEERSAGIDGVTALGFGQHAGGLLMAVGHASGQVKLWETRPTAGASGGISWVLGKAIVGAHASQVSACCVVGGGASTWVLTTDTHGRLMCHSAHKHLSLTAQALAGFARKLLLALRQGALSFELPSGMGV